MYIYIYIYIWERDVVIAAIALTLNISVNITTTVTITIKMIIHICSPKSFCCRSSGGLSLVLGFCAAGCAAFYGGQLLCAGCGDRAWCLRPSRTKRPVAPVSTEKHHSFYMIFLRDCPGLLGASGCLWGPPGSLLGASGCLLVPLGWLLDASWVPP